MKITDLPEEIILMIIKELDFKSVHQLYNSCRQLRHYVCMIKECHMSLNCIATAQTLKSNFFIDIARNLYLINMCGIPDLTKTLLHSAMKRMTNLKILDISYTNANIIDLLSVYQNCPNLRDITINFTFGKPGLTKLSQKTINECQNMFQVFENVNFIGSLSNLLFSKLSLYLLSKSKLNTLKYTVSECDYVTTIEPIVDCDQLPIFDQFNLFLLNDKDNLCYSRLPLLHMFDLTHYEFIIVCVINAYDYKYSVFVSQVFQKFFYDRFGINAECVTDLHRPLLGNSTAMFWRKESVIFDDLFFKRLSTRMKPYFPFHFISFSNDEAPEKYDWFITVPMVPDVEEVNRDKYEPELKKQRLVAPNLILNYDKVLRKKSQVQLSIVFDGCLRNAVTLSSNCDYLKKLTYLSLSGSVRYSMDFFNTLFRCCKNLETLDVEAFPISSCASAISRSIPLSRTLKNFRLIDKRIDFITFFASLSLCKTIENICIQDECEYEINDLGDPSLILERCHYLYSIYIVATLSESSKNKKLQLINKAKARCQRYHLNVEIYNKDSKSRYHYTPFLSVFQLSPIKPI